MLKHRFFRLPISIILFFCSAGSFAAEIKLVVDQNYADVLLSELDKAEDSIDILQFSFAIDRNGKVDTSLSSYAIARKLVSLKKARPQLKIRLYIEGERSTGARNKITAAFLEKAGIQVKFGATHAKAFAIDGKNLLLGSTNLTHQSLHFNNETNVLIMDYPNTTKAFEKYYEQLWQGEKRSALVSEAEMGVQLLTDSAYKQRILESARSATKTLDFSIYYFNDLEIEKALVHAHQKNKVKIRGYLNQHDSVATDLVERNKQTKRRLEMNGVKNVYLDLPIFFSHSKYLIADNRFLVVGTGNWNKSDFERHPQLYLSIDNAYLADKLSRHLSQQIAYESEREAPLLRHHRLWLGWVKDKLSVADFDTTIRDVFVRATVKTGEFGGLHAYIPVLNKPIESVQPSPQEIALISYEDEETYRAIRDSEAGSVYGPLHFDYFSPTSKSAVAEPWRGDLEIGKAYDFSRSKVNWQIGDSFFILSQRVSDASAYTGQLNNFFKRIASYIQTTRESIGYLALIQDEFLVEYVNVRSSSFDSVIKNFLDHRQFLHDRGILQYRHFEKCTYGPFTGNQLTRSDATPDKQDFASREPPACVSAKFSQALKAPLFLNNSASTFARNEDQQEQLRAKIKEAFIDLTPIPTRDL